MRWQDAGMMTRETANAVFVIEEVLVGAGLQEPAHRPGLGRQARAFALRIMLASNHGQARELIRAHPKEAAAFLGRIIYLRELLEAGGTEISGAPEMPLELYCAAANAVLESF